MTSPSSLPTLQTLDGRPLTWAELHRRNAEWWAAHDTSDRFEPVPVVVFNGGIWRVVDLNRRLYGEEMRA